MLISLSEYVCVCVCVYVCVKNSGNNPICDIFSQDFYEVIDGNQKAKLNLQSTFAVYNFHSEDLYNIFIFGGRFRGHEFHCCLILEGIL